ncbi:hypothetical protein F2Q70_00001513 [Brassica cretica]|uniref:Beta-carotene isomerase D27-like C-terminal domain-containing protein n=1 Tax=Brassica cretica TaxID=69181 RepID=A0A8S9J2X3_BRACR|nr:hypothetical protein F2Q70_00001513 [Brassica cretica]
MQGRSRTQQQEVVREVLLSMLPPGAPEQFRKLFPPTKWAADLMQLLQCLSFTGWLVLLRYLENSGCVGMCVNMCKIPTQDFFTNEFGLPLTMNPNFDDMSCEMIYGQAPPAFEDDPATKQPCLAYICTSCKVLCPIQARQSALNYKHERYLENSGCVGMCVNMCKIPTQDFFTNEFGLPLTMNPNFDDMSCEMIYGQAPPAFEDDPATKQPCLAYICSMSNPSSPVCPKLQA